MAFDRLVPGMDKNDIDTPALLLDMELLEHNISTIAGYISSAKKHFRPHVKSHRTPMIAHKQIEAGAIGISCAKVSEAEVMIESGIKDVFIANQVVGGKKIAKLVRLAGYGKVCVAVDNLENARRISEAAIDKGMKIDVLIELDVGTHRCGLTPGKTVLDFAKKLEKYQGLRIKGLMAYEGFCNSIPDFKEKEKACKGALNTIIQTRDLLLDSNINVEVISVGTTGTYKICADYPGITEIRAGSYILSSAGRKATSPEFEVAFTLLSTVISRPSKDRAVIDAGKNAISSDSGLPLVEGLEGVKLRSLWDEHGVLEIKNFNIKLEVGDKIELVPTHPCTTVALHDKMFCIKEDILESVWEIKTRGKFF